MKNQISYFDQLSRSVATAPWVLVTYTVFAVAVSLTDFIILPRTSDAFREKLVPYTGWGASMPYIFTIYFSFALIFERKRRMANRFSITGLLILVIALNAWRFSQASGDDFGNPYLTISSWRPIWTILIPSLWIAVLYTPRMNCFCTQTFESAKV